MENEITTDRIHDIEEDALSAAGEEHDETNEITEFKPSQVPGEGFVAAARHNDQALWPDLHILAEILQNIIIFSKQHFDEFHNWVF